MNRIFAIPSAIFIACATMLVAPAAAAPPAGTQLSGANFTSDAAGTPVNLDVYDAKEDVYLNGGSGINAPDGAAGLPAGTYSFQVTDPSGKVLLSSDSVAGRQFTVDAGGVIQETSPSRARVHATGPDGEDGRAIIQLLPYADTTNNGGVYEVRVIPTDKLDCSAAGNKNCFVPRYSKVDNYKVRSDMIVEIDVRLRKNGVAMDGYAATWTDTNGAKNVKYSEWKPGVLPSARPTSGQPSGARTPFAWPASPAAPWCPSRHRRTRGQGEWHGLNRGRGRGRGRPRRWQPHLLGGCHLQVRKQESAPAGPGPRPRRPDDGVPASSVPRSGSPCRGRW